MELICFARQKRHKADEAKTWYFYGIYYIYTSTNSHRTHRLDRIKQISVWQCVHCIRSNRIGDETAICNVQQNFDVLTLVFGL